MGREIDDREPAARLQHARRLTQGAPRVLGVVQHLMKHGCVEALAGERQLVHVALAERAIAQARALQVDPRHRQHLAGEIDADRVLDARAEQLEHSAGTGADVEEIADAVRRQQGD